MTYYQVSLPGLALTNFQRAAESVWGLVLAALITVSFPSALGDELVNERNDLFGVWSATRSAKLTLSSSIGASGNILDAKLVVPDVGNAPLLVGAAVVCAVEHLSVSYAFPHPRF